MASDFQPLLDRNQSFSQTGAHQGLEPMPRHQVFVITCLDARVDPAHILGVELGDALVFRNGGGRVTEEALREIAFIATVTEQMFGDDAPPFEVSVIHHTHCGTGFLADAGFRARYAERLAEGAIDFDDEAVAQHAVLDPRATVAEDVAQIRACRAIPERVRVSGHVYDVETGRVTTLAQDELRG